MKRAATPAEINAAFEFARTVKRSALTPEEVASLDKQLAEIIERDAPEPKISEIFFAAASGYLEPFGMGNQQYSQMQQQGGGSMSMGPTFDSGDYSRAKSTAAAFEAIGRLYAKRGM